MANPGEEAIPASTTGGGADMETYLASILGAAGISAEAQIKMSQIGAESALEQQRNQQRFLTEGAEVAAGIYKPWSKRGQDYLKQYDWEINKGAPQYNWGREFTYEPWKWDKKFDYQSLGDFSKERFTPEGMVKSPYYGLYQFQKDQQDQAINQSLRSRGLYNSGAGMKQSLNIQSGLDQKFAADEYGRGMTEYGVGYDRELAQYLMDYEQQLQQHNTGYEEAKQKYGMSYDQYNKTFGVKSGQYTDRLGQLQSQGQYGWLADQATANAKFGASSQMGQGAIQTGQTMAGLQSSLSSGIGSTYNAAANTAAGLYNASAQRSLTQSLANQGQANYAAANSTNQNLGYATLASGLARSGLDAYRYYNQPSVPSTPTYNDPGYGTSYGNAYGNAPYTGNYVYGD
jgi:hypothetical protein